jgi:UDP-glucose 4-epimerase
MNIVILGGSGFLGSNLVRHLHSEGHFVHSVSRSPNPVLGPGHRHSDLTLDDRRSLLPLLEDADFLFHLASDSTPGSSRLQPVLEGMNNLMPTLQLLESLQQRTLPRLVYISSGGAVYNPQASSAPFSETAATLPQSYYGAGKLAAEAFIAAANRQTGQPALILRPSNVYGPGQRAKKQFGIVPTLLGAIRKEQAFTIWGDGSAIRDYLFIEDFLDLCSRLLHQEWAEDCLELFNCGSGQGLSVNQLCDSVEQVTGRQLQRKYESPRGVDTPAVTLNCERAAQRLGWSAATPLDSGLGKTWQWFRS